MAAVSEKDVSSVTPDFYDYNSEDIPEPNR